eukprot:3939627-Rhodomonas_salina.2
MAEDFLVTFYGVYINGSPGPIHIVGEKVCRIQDRKNEVAKSTPQRLAPCNHNDCWHFVLRVRRGWGLCGAWN